MGCQGIIYSKAVKPYTRSNLVEARLLFHNSRDLLVKAPSILVVFYVYGRKSFYTRSNLVEII